MRKQLLVMLGALREQIVGLPDQTHKQTRREQKPPPGAGARPHPQCMVSG